MNPARFLILLCYALSAGCAAPSDRLTFPLYPLERSSRGWFYDVSHQGHPDFALLPDGEGRLDRVAYDDAGNGHFNRVYRLSDYADGDVPHLIVLLDSIPYHSVAKLYASGDFRWCNPPQKLIPPFPSLTEISFSKLLGAPPLPGVVDDFYDRDIHGSSNSMWQRLLQGYHEPWERRLAYDMSMYQSGLAYLDPRPWYQAELALAKKSFDHSPDRVTLVYFGSASAMLSKYGQKGLDEVLDGIERMCLQTLYERQGAVKISLLADHGHNLMTSQNISLDAYLKAAGFHVTNRLKGPKDVVLELQGLVTYAGIRTNDAPGVAKALTACSQIDLAAYLDGERLIVQNAKGRAAIESHRHQLCYHPIDADVLNYDPVITALRKTGKLHESDCASDDDWFTATLDHEYPDALRRLWDAFHGTVTHPPEVMITTRDGYCAGRKDFERFIKMASTHGSLNQINSATFVMSMTERVTKPLRSREVLSVIEPGFIPTVR